MRVRRATLMLFLALVAVGQPEAARATPGRSLPDPALCPGCWTPAVETSWQWQLSGDIDTSIDVEMYDIDMEESPASLVQTLHGDGRHVVCYISAGSVENWRSDAADFPPAVIGSKLDGWAGERWLDVRKRRALRPIMTARIQRCAAKGFDGIEFDNVDGWANDTGFPITRDDQLRYNVMLANLAHAKGLAAALKNDVEQVKVLEPYFDMALNEECFSYDECARLLPFVAAGKPVFQVEYELETADFCSQANAMDFNSLKKKWNLGVWREACR